MKFVAIAVDCSQPRRPRRWMPLGLDITLTRSRVFGCYLPSFPSSSAVVREHVGNRLAIRGEAGLPPLDATNLGRYLAQTRTRLKSNYNKV